MKSGKARASRSSSRFRSYVIINLLFLQGVDVKKALLLLIAVLLGFLNSYASDPHGGKVVKKIVVIGCETIPEKTVRYYISLKEGEPFSREKVAKDIKTLYKLGYFENISVDVKDYKGGLLVRYFVKERPVITDVVFKGNRRISSKKLKEELGLRTEEGEEKKLMKPLSYKYLDEMKEKIASLYEKKGYPGTVVKYTIDRISPTRAVVTFIISEGKKADVCRIVIKGNRKVKSKEIKKVLETKEKSIWRFRFAAPLSSEKLKKDVVNIRNLYYSKGYLDVEVGEPEVNEVKGCYQVTYVIRKEGKKYRFGRVDFKGNNLFTERELRKLSKRVRKGKRYNQDLVNELADRIEKKYMELGFIFTRVDPKISINRKEHVADVTFNIFEGERAYVRNINIKGNVATRDRTIRRELDLYETGIFNTVRLERSVRRLFNTGYFENVNVKPKITGNKVDVDVDVAERLTGMFSIGAGYSSVSKLVGMVSVSKGNLFGTGDSGSASVQLGSRVAYLDLNYAHRWWLNKPQTLNLSIYNHRNEYFTYTSHKVGFSVGVNRRIWEDWSVGIGYSFERNRITDIEEDAPSIVKDEEGTENIGLVFGSITRDLRDNRFLPHKGSYASLRVRLAGSEFAGDENFYSIVADYSYYYNLNNLPVDINLPFVASVHTRLGYADALGGTKRVPIDYRFYVGGDSSVRGFKWGEAGPKDSHGDPEGANREFIMNLEFGYDVMKMLRVIAFLDVGAGWWDTVNLGDLREGAGIGIRVMTPMGPIRFDWGFKLDRKSGEKPSEWHFGMGSYF